MQDKAEAKLKSLEMKAQEQQKARLAADEEWRRQQRERELTRLHVSLLLLATMTTPFHGRFLLQSVSV